MVSRLPAPPLFPPPAAPRLASSQRQSSASASSPPGPITFSDPTRAYEGGSLMAAKEKRKLKREERWSRDPHVPPLFPHRPSSERQ